MDRVHGAALAACLLFGEAAAVTGAAAEHCWDMKPGYNAVARMVRAPHDERRPELFYFGEFTSIEACRTACDREVGCAAFTWMGAGTGGWLGGGNKWARQCYGRGPQSMTMVPDRNYYSGVKVSCEEMAELERSFGVDHKKMHDAGGGAGRPLRSGDGSPQGVQTLEQLGGGQANDADPRSAGGANKARAAGRGDTPGRVQALEQPIGGVAAADDSGESDAERLVRELYGYQTARPGPAGGALGGAAGAAGKAGSNAAGARSPFSGAAQGGAAVAGAHGDNPPSSLTSGGKPAGDTTMGGATGAVGSGSAFTLEQLLGGGGADGVAPKARGASDEELLSLLDRGKRAGGGAATKAGAAGGAQTLERLLSGGAAEGAGGVGASGAEHAGRGKLGGRVETAAATGSGSAQTLEQLLLAGRAPNGGAAAVGSVGDADLLSLLGGAPRAAAGVAAEAATRDSAGGAQTLEQLLGGGPGHRGAIEFDLSLLGAGAAGGAGVAGGTAGDAAPAAVTPGASSAAADGAADLSARARMSRLGSSKRMESLRREGAGGATAQLSPNGGAAPRVPPQQRREDPPNGAAQQLTSSPPRAEATVEPGGAAALRASAPHGASAAQHAAAANQQPGELLVDAGMDDMD